MLIWHFSLKIDFTGKIFISSSGIFGRPDRTYADWQIAHHEKRGILPGTAEESIFTRGRNHRLRAVHFCQRTATFAMSSHHDRVYCPLMWTTARPLCWNARFRNKRQRIAARRVHPRHASAALYVRPPILSVDQTSDSSNNAMGVFAVLNRVTISTSGTLKHIKQSVNSCYRNRTSVQHTTFNHFFDRLSYRIISSTWYYQVIASLEAFFE